MEELIELIDNRLQYVQHTINEDRIMIEVETVGEEAVCPYCGYASKRAHSRYERRFQDLPIQGKKVGIVLINRKMFCGNAECGHKTFAETFDFLPRKAKRSKRLTDEIVKVALEVSSVTASQMLRAGVADALPVRFCAFCKIA